MNVLVDENIPAMTAEALREFGHDVQDVRGTAGEGMSDEALVKLINHRGMRIARRTIAKYRKELGILPSHLRKEF